MEAKVETTDKGIEVNVEDLEGKQDELLEAFQECNEGRCTCPTEEYKKVQTLDVKRGPDSIQLSIIAKDGEHIDAGEIEKCLAYTAKRVAED